MSIGLGTFFGARRFIAVGWDQYTAQAAIPQWKSMAITEM